MFASHWPHQGNDVQFAEELAELKQHSGKHKSPSAFNTDVLPVVYQPAGSRARRGLTGAGTPAALVTKPWAEVLSDLKSLLKTGSSLYA